MQNRQPVWIDNSVFINWPVRHSKWLFFSLKHLTINQEGPNNGSMWPLTDTVSGVTPPKYNFAINF